MRTVLSRLPCCISFLILALCTSNNGVVGSRLSRRHHDTVRHMSMEVEDSPFDDFPFRNTSLPWDERVDDLVSRLTLQEVMVQMSRGGAGDFGGPAPAIPRLGIGAYNWDTECLRGDAGAVENATGFPQAIGLAATFSPDIIMSVATATGQEVRAKHNDFVKRGIFATHTSASCFSPVINIMRDPRWGRNQETYGEDPFMTGVLAQNFVRGIQGPGTQYIMTSAGCKHFDAYAGPENIPVTRFVFDAQVSDTDWRMTFLPAFKKCVQAGTYSIMCSYNSVNGVPACASKQLLTDILRTEWNFKGYVVSDQGAVECVGGTHKYLNDSVDIAAACVNAGTNLELSGNQPTPVYMSILDAIDQGKLTEELVRERVKPLFYTRMRLGEFDPEEDNPYAQLSMDQIESAEHQVLAVTAAMKSFVLLKNQGGILPLKKGDFSKVAIIGPMADNAQQIFGDYAPNQDRSFTQTPLDGLRSLYPDIKYAKVCNDGTPCTEYNKGAVPDIVSDKELVFVALGTGQAVEREGNDRPDVELAGQQKQLLLDVLDNSGSAQIILLLFSASPLNITFADESDRVAAIMECFFPAQATGEALYNVLTNNGQYSSPAGRLPSTWPLASSQIPPMVNYSMEGRTYRYFKGDPLYPFGYGLSYTQFVYSTMTLRWVNVNAGGDLELQLAVTNVGPVDGDEVVQCYISWADTTLPVPQLQLAYFTRVFIPSQQTRMLSITISGESMAFWRDGQWLVEDGVMYLYCGGQQPNQKRKVPSNVLSTYFYIVGSKVMNMWLQSLERAVAAYGRGRAAAKEEQWTSAWHHTTPKSSSGPPQWKQRVRIGPSHDSIDSMKVT
ncbi:xylan 1,4-beta-xylosidase [Aplysia californica]|uniref:Xylan 1,4-beta-xylosidase n=1 Tax=Aplysia californica TaxID=6500 RepID=A0ABM1A1T3_APLCA|nr:xylan 1,4-beta-xylosidase [Aplysia californica]